MNGIRLTSPDYPAGRAAFCFGVLVSGVVIFGGLWLSGVVAPGGFGGLGVLLPAIFCLSCIVAAKMRVRFFILNLLIIKCLTISNAHGKGFDSVSVCARFWKVIDCQ